MLSSPQIIIILYQQDSHPMMRFSYQSSKDFPDNSNLIGWQHLHNESSLQISHPHLKYHQSYPSSKRRNYTASFTSSKPFTPNRNKTSFCNFLSYSPRHSPTKQIIPINATISRLLLVFPITQKEKPTRNIPFRNPLRKTSLSKTSKPNPKPSDTGSNFLSLTSIRFPDSGSCTDPPQPLATKPSLKPRTYTRTSLSQKKSSER